MLNIFKRGSKILFLISFFYIGAFAQPTDPNGGEKPTNVPIDGGLLYLIAGGTAYGIYKIRNKKKQ